MDVHISSRLLGDIRARAERSEAEVCGLLLGRGDTILDAPACRNIAADPRRRFEIDPAALIAAHRVARQGGAAVLGHYHSHPAGRPVPSVCDAAEAAPDGTLWLIVAGDECRAWRATASGVVEGRFDPVRLHVTPPCAPHAAPPEERD